jgi:TPR repeat protein
MSEKHIFALVRNPARAVEKAAPGARRVLAGMVADTLALNNAEAKAWFEKGESYRNSNNFPEAFKCYLKAAEQNHVEAQFNVGFDYEHGHPIVKDEVEAVKWYRKAAEQGDAVAQYALGKCYYDGTGVDWPPRVMPLLVRQFPVVSVCCFASTQGSGGRRA